MKKLFLALLLAIPAQSQVSGPGIDYCDFGGAPVPVVSPLATQMKGIVQAKCASCHSGGKVNGGIPDILVKKNLDSLINLADPPASKLYDVVKTDYMPLGKTKLTLPEKGVFLEWIKAGAEDWDDVSPVLPSGFVSYEQILACVLQDVRNIEYSRAGDSADYEYFDLSNAYNSGDPEKFKNLGYALDGALNKTAANFSEGTANARTYNSRPVDKAGIIRAVFAPEANKDARKDFDQRLLVDGKYPFKIDFTKGNYKTRQQRDDIAFLESEITRLTGRALPYVRADFAIDQIMLKQYYEFLGIDIKRQKQLDIEKVVGVDSARQIFNLEVRALGSERSGVGNFNRIIHQYHSIYSLGGSTTRTSLWKTFDVDSELGRKNLLAFPLGPEGSKFDNFQTDNLFEFVAGESIGQLPNGEMFFLVSLANGQFLREADSKVVFDRDRVKPFFGSAPGVIVNGGGCVSCHAGGMNYLSDQVSAISRSLAGINADELNAIEAIYPQQSYWDVAFKTFSTSFQKAHASYSPDPLTRVGSSEPITKALSVFLDLVSIKDAAGEFNVTEESLVKCLEHLPAVARAVKFSGSSVTRDGLNDQFDEIAQGCGYGRQVVFFKAKPPGKRDCIYGFTNHSDYRVGFIADFGSLGATSVLLFPSETKNFTFKDSGDIEGQISDVRYAAKELGSWGGDKSLNGGKITGCRAYEFYNGSGRPQIK
jgi:hypothetical protein